MALCKKCQLQQARAFLTLSLFIIWNAFNAVFAVGSAVLVPNYAKADILARTLKPEPRFGEV